MIIEETKKSMALEFNVTCNLKQFNIDQQSINSDYTKLVLNESDQKQVCDNKGFGSNSVANINHTERFQEVDNNIQEVNNTLQSQSTGTCTVDQQECDSATVSRTSVKVRYFPNIQKINLVKHF